ncbi:MAG: hypothetical protein OEV51_07825 [Nitrospira sp.]|nr:hypothetical protein [Nitrospira sp.]
MFGRVLPFLVLPPLLLSCGESGGLFTSTTNPCSLLTVAEAQQALGEPVQEGTLSDPSTCLFKAHRHDGNAVTVQLEKSIGNDQRVWFNKERLGRDSRLIPGLGDGAFRIDSSPTLSRLTFMHRDALVTVIIASTKQKHLGESVTLLSRAVASHYGATLTTTLPPTTSNPIPSEGIPTHLVSRSTPVSLTQTLPGPSETPAGPHKAPSLDPTGLIGTWHTRSTQGTTQHNMLLIIKPNLEWSLSSMMQFDGVVNAEGGLWLLERANTFKGLGWKGSYRKKTADSFASSGSVQATWTRLAPDEDPKRIPTELWKLRREATSVPVFQIKTVDPDLVGQWEGAGTYAGGSAAFVWAIKPSAATDLLIVESLRGTVKTKDGLPQLQPIKKKSQRVSVVAIYDHGFTTTDGKTNLRWSKLHPESPEDRQL